jgi:hypothetical protein
MDFCHRFCHRTAQYQPDSDVIDWDKHHELTRWNMTIQHELKSERTVSRDLQNRCSTAELTRLLID